MDMHRYESFLKAVELGSTDKAAKALGCTQRELNSRLAALERELSLDLLLRDRKAVSLTESGKRLYPLIRDVVNAGQCLTAEVNDILDLQSGLVRIGTFTSVSVHILPRLIHEFNQQYPGISFELFHGEYGQIEDWLLEGRVDIGFLRSPVRKGLQGRDLGRDRLLIVLPHDHPCAELSFFPIERLGEEDFVLLKAGEDPEIEGIFARHKVKPNVRLRAWDDYAIMSMVESGLGISIMPELVLRRTPYNVVVKELAMPEYRGLELAVRAGIRLSPAVNRFLSFAEENMSIFSE